MTFPPDFTYPEAKATTAAVAAHRIAALAPAHRAVVQAGGCSGLWPLALARSFDRVYTFEPHPGNYAYLAANIAGTPSITAFPYALGDHAGRVGLTRPKPKAGLWRVDGDGDIPLTALDAVVTDGPLDAIVLDVEGSEAPALRGAARLLTTHRPLLWFEGLHHTAAIAAVLAAHDYLPAQRGLGSDWYSVHASRVGH